MSGPTKLLQDGDPPPVRVLRENGRSDLFLTADHAGRVIPRRLGRLGLPADELIRHIGWDIGIASVTEHLSTALDATAVLQTYSRLVIDCNRDPAVASSIPTVSEHSDIPGNVDLSAAQIAARRREIFDPYHGRVRALLDARLKAGRPTILVAQHSMTDVYKGVRRAMHAAILYNRDRRFAALMLEMLRREPALIVADNEPYFVSDETDYSIPRHGEARGLPHVEIEIRQDLIGEEAGQSAWARRIARALLDAEQDFAGTHR